MTNDEILTIDPYTAKLSEQDIADGLRLYTRDSEEEALYVRQYSNFIGIVINTFGHKYYHEFHIINKKYLANLNAQPNPDKTFIDLYMKSGMFITEIVKRLYRNAKMKRLFPDDQQRLRHIFERQVYGLAPTEIIYRIAMNYILGFQSKTSSLRHNFRKLDALPYAKSGTLEAKLSETYA